MTSTEFRTIRDRLGLSQAELGRLMGLHAREVSRIETYRSPTRLQAAFIKHIERWQVTPDVAAELIESGEVA